MQVKDFIEKFKDKPDHELAVYLEDGELDYAVMAYEDEEGDVPTIVISGN